MANDLEQRWKRVGTAVGARRRARGYPRQQDAADAGDIGVAKWGQVERGEPGPHADNTIAGVERALAWKPGSVAAILAGGEPTPITEEDQAVSQLEELTQMVRDIATRLQRMEETLLDAAPELCAPGGPRGP